LKREKKSRQPIDAELLRQKREASIRRHRKTILFNDKELNVLNSYFEKYKVKSKTRFCREAIIATVLRQLEEDHPRLF
jgi:hypothetical protein